MAAFANDRMQRMQKRQEPLRISVSPVGRRRDGAAIHLARIAGSGTGCCESQHSCPWVHSGCVSPLGPGGLLNTFLDLSAFSSPSKSFWVITQSTLWSHISQYGFELRVRGRGQCFHFNVIALPPYAEYSQIIHSIISQNSRKQNLLSFYFD